MLLSIPPKYSVSSVVGYIKGKSAIHLARVYGEHRIVPLLDRRVKGVHVDMDDFSNPRVVHPGQIIRFGTL
jgi:REP element-mobilizing transposase RayT